MQRRPRKELTNLTVMVRKHGEGRVGLPLENGLAPDQ
jgi:hypothetical protein